MKGPSKGNGKEEVTFFINKHRKDFLTEKI